jgi:molybdopterin converting factor subunit 1
VAKVLLFGAAADLAGGAREVEVPAEPGATLAEVWSGLAERYPDLAPMRGSLAFAVNGEYAGPETAVSEGDEVAVLPPVSGG